MPENAFKLVNLCMYSNVGNYQQWGIAFYDCLTISFSAYVNMFMRHLCEPDNPEATTYSDEVPKETVSRQNILTRIGIMRLVRNKVQSVQYLRHVLHVAI